MSLAKKCDICGKLYEYYGGDNGYSIERIGSHGRNLDTAYTADLCPECMEALKNFIESRKHDGRQL